MGQFKNSWLEINQAKATFIRKNKSLWVYFGAGWWTPLKKEKKLQINTILPIICQKYA